MFREVVEQTARKASILMLGIGTATLGVSVAYSHQSHEETDWVMMDPTVGMHEPSASEQERTQASLNMKLGAGELAGGLVLAILVSQTGESRVRRWEQTQLAQARQLRKIHGFNELRHRA